MTLLRNPKNLPLRHSPLRRSPLRRPPLRQRVTAALWLAQELWLFALSLLPSGRVPRFRAASRHEVRVLLLPGLLATDAAMRPLRFALRRAGYRAYRWGLGRNRGATEDLFARLDRRLDQIQAEDRAPVVLVGWSFGGLIAREYAKAAPHRVRAVITLGSPFSGDISATMLPRFYAWVAGHRVEAAPIACTLAEKPPVPTIALWSARDGVIPAFAARGGDDEADHYIELNCAHLAFPFDPCVAEAVIGAIGDCCPAAQPAPKRARPRARLGAAGC